MDLLGMPSAGEAFYRPNTNTDVRTYPIGSRVHPRILIGGTHFWGHADFFVTFPITTFRQSQELETWYNPGVETGALIYPWRLQQGALRPYVGASWSIINYRQTVSGERRGPDLHRSRVSLKGGFGWQNKTGLWEMGISWLPSRSFRYPLSRNHFETVTLPRWSFRLSYKYLFDTTDRYEGEASRGRISSRIQKYRDAGKLNTFSVAVGYSGAYTLSPSSHNDQQHPYLDNPANAKPFPDISAGYYFYKPDASIRLSWRSIRQSQEAFGIEQNLFRRSFALDFLKFLGDYHGFVPFIGPFVSKEYLRTKELDQGRQLLNTSHNGWTAGIVFGWDIRPIRTPGLIFRTNLRYTPNLSLKTEDEQKIRFNQLEFNFIQLVVYPERLF
ncbi:MAG TPA: hypothetical protein VK074_03015 [Fodinibius sp.]|nr:hypothetical protein [Fodinibius sp.]